MLNAVEEILQKMVPIFFSSCGKPTKWKSPILEDFAVLKEFANVFNEILGLPPKRDIDFSIDLVLGDAIVSNIPYIMSTLELKELQMQLEELLKKGYICILFGSIHTFCKEETCNLEVLHRFQTTK